MKTQAEPIFLKALLAGAGVGRASYAEQVSGATGTGFSKSAACPLVNEGRLPKRTVNFKEKVKELISAEYGETLAKYGIFINNIFKKCRGLEKTEYASINAARFPFVQPRLIAGRRDGPASANHETDKFEKAEAENPREEEMATKRYEILTWKR